MLRRAFIQNNLPVFTGYGLTLYQLAAFIGIGCNGSTLHELEKEAVFRLGICPVLQFDNYLPALLNLVVTCEHKVRRNDLIELAALEHIGA